MSLLLIHRLCTDQIIDLPLQNIYGILFFLYGFF